MAGYPACRRSLHDPEWWANYEAVYPPYLLMILPLFQGGRFAGYPSGVLFLSLVIGEVLLLVLGGFEFLSRFLGGKTAPRRTAYPVRIKGPKGSGQAATGLFSAPIFKAAGAGCSLIGEVLSIE
jgi:hypothetical protein